LRPEAEFQTSIPDEGIEEDGDFVEFPGRKVTEAISAMLSGLGYEMSAPFHAEHAGWELDARANGRRIWLRIASMDDTSYALFTKDMTWQFWRRDPSFADFLTGLNAALQQDDRFDEILWSRDWRDNTRSPDPVTKD